MQNWLLLIVSSAVVLSFYDISKKAAVNGNSVMPTLFFATLSGTTFYLLALPFAGVSLAAAAACGPTVWHLIFVKALLVSGVWTFSYYALRVLPISIVVPIRASSPLWNFIGGVILFHEVPSPLHGLAMLLVFAGYYLFSVAGRMEGISFLKHRGIHFIMIGTLFASASALYDKQVLGVWRIPRETVQLWFSIDLVIILGTLYAIRMLFFRKGVEFQWRWTVPLAGILLIVSDYFYFASVSCPDTQIAMITLVRRGAGVVLTFLPGSALFHDRNVKRKAVALALIVAGVLLLAF